MATLLDVMAQAKKAGMRTNHATLVHNGQRVIVMAFSLPDHDVMANPDGSLVIDGRNVTDPTAWDDLRDVMAEVEK